MSEIPTLPAVRGAVGIGAHLRKSILDGLYLYRSEEHTSELQSH